MTPASTSRTCIATTDGSNSRNRPIYRKACLSSRPRDGHQYLKWCRVFYNRHKDKQTNLSSKEISDVSHPIVNIYSRAFVIIDALDKCRISGRILPSEAFSPQVKTGTNLFAASRFISEIMKEFEGIVSSGICTTSITPLVCGPGRPKDCMILFSRD